VTDRPRFTPSKDNPDNILVTQGNGFSDEELDVALKNALLYFDTPYEDIPETREYKQTYIGTKNGVQCACKPDGSLPEGGKIDDEPIPITWVTLKPEPEPDPEPEEETEELDLVEFDPEINLDDEVKDARARLHRESGPWSLELADWFNGANLSIFMAAPGRVASLFELIRRGDISDVEAQDLLYDDLLTTAAAAFAWADAIKRARAVSDGA
jgi:hypothetical protein